MAVISDVMRGPFGDIQPNVIITMRALGTSARVLVENKSSVVTDAAGKYSMTVFPGEYEVTVSTLGVVGTIRVFPDSVNGTLNDFLIAPAKPEELTPEVVRTVDTFRSEAATSAAAAKVSEDNSAAAMANALSKVVTTEQSVAGAVTFAKSPTFSSGFTTLSEVTLQGKTAAANVIQRFKDMNGVEKGSIYVSSDTGLMNIRWAGTSYTMQGREDGFISIPKGIMIGAALSTPGDVSNAVTTLGGYPFIFRGADTAGLDNPNNLSVGTSYGFSVVATYTGNVSAGVVLGKPVFSVNARTGNTFVLNELFVKNRPAGIGSITLGTLDLNTVVDEGPYYQAVTANATLARNYPIVAAGVLKVLKSRASTNGKEAVTQLYYPWHAADYYYSRVYTPSTDTWSGWEIFDSRSKNDTRYLQIGAYGLGADYRPAVTGVTLASDYRINGPVFFSKNTVTDSFGGEDNHILNVFGNTARSSGLQIASNVTATARLGFRRIASGVAGSWAECWTDRNTAVDANGFLKKASPIVKLFGDGSSELNEQSQGVTTERISEGVYRVSGVMGFNSDPAWGGPNGGIGLPKDNNDLALLWVDYEVDETGDLLIKTFHRINSTAPKFAQNIVAGYKEGQPIDIPAGRWIDLRVEMPAGDEPEPIVEPEPLQDDKPAPEAVTEIVAEQQPEQETEQNSVTESDADSGVHTGSIGEPDNEVKD
ncbi:prophage tail fiber N-terminal domain-containing protein [Serratia oryzae]|uniref:phage tail fiber protein n=1 Tax=Serratia oryzae TaxID=2034155 RepID=UPI0012E14D4C|nr:prophage tail fiber N-terminal domain-containing protein [Serratia oryzae]